MRFARIATLRHSRSALTAGVFFVAFLIAGLVAWGALSAIEGISKSAIERALLLDGEEWAKVETDGLQVMLSGTAPTESARFRVLAVAGGEVDAGRLIDLMDVPAPKAITPPEFSIEMLRSEAGISMIGLIPAAADRDDLASRVQQIDTANAMTDLLETADYPVPDRWDDALAFALDALEMLPRSKISVRADRVAIEAIADSGEQKGAWEKALRAQAPGGVRIALDISAPRPVVTPFTLRFVVDEEGPRFDACTANTEKGRSTIISAGIAAGVKGQPDCTIALGVPSPDWPDAVARGIAAIREIGGGSLTFSDADVTLIAAEGTPQNTFDRVVGELEADLPEVFSLHAVLPVAATDADSGPPEFTATLSPEGHVQLRGRVLDAQERTIVESVARARFGVDNVYSAMRLDSDLPRGWSVRQLAAIEALGQLSKGAVVVQPEVVDVRGSTGDKAASAEISRVLSEKLGEAEDFRVNVLYDEKFDPAAALPTPEECAADINAILAEEKITFAPGSAEIELASGRTIDSIAAILKTCPDVAMEIGGYTDSQGREEMNQALSQRRADSVLSALLSRRVLTSNLTSHGYGEQDPIASNETEEGREANRRIEFRLIGTSARADEAALEPDALGAETPPMTDEDVPAVRPEARPEELAPVEDAAGAEDAAVSEPTAEDDAAAQAAADADTGADASTEEAAPDETPTVDAATETTSAEEVTPEPASEEDETPLGDPVVVDPELAGIRPQPRPAQ